ncbi:OmpA family protein [Myroides sp. LJL110]
MNKLVSSKIVLVFLAVLCSFSMHGKRKPSLKLADKYYKNKEYTKAASEYKRLERGRRTENYIYLQLADCYNKLDRDIEASKYYGKAIQNDASVDAEIYYRYAKILQKTGRYEVARDMMDDYAALKPQDSKAKDFLKNPDAYYELYKLPEDFMFAETGFNDRQFQDYGAILTPGDTLFFVSNQTKHKKKIPRKLFEVRTPSKREPNFDIYMAQYKDAKEPIFISTRLKGKINKRFNDGPLIQSVVKNQVIFTSDSYRFRAYRKIKQVKQRDGIKNLFTATKKKNKYRKIKKLPFTQGNYTYQNAAISPDSTYLYFASNMPGSYGELDIWRVEILDDAIDFGEPQNLGPVINSGTKNDFPFISQDNVLYFSSDRWGGYGGMDIYSYDLNDPKAKVVNLGAPLNTPRDEFAFSFYPRNNIGFVSTNRIGRTDIYKVFPVCEVPVEVIVKSKTLQMPVYGAKVLFTNSVRKELEPAFTDLKGTVSIPLNCQGAFTLDVSHEDFLDEQLKVVVKKQDASMQVIVELTPLQDLVIKDSFIELADINFAFDQKEITPESKQELDKLVKVMKRYASMVVQINSHTDSKGKESYNLKLSSDRAKATYDYLISQGIDSDRLKYQGFGSSKPKVDCKDCSELQDAMNRRSEFIILQK